jgi:hypothetical protein
VSVECGVGRSEEIEFSNTGFTLVRAALRGRPRLLGLRFLIFARVALVPTGVSNGKVVPCDEPLFSGPEGSSQLGQFPTRDSRLRTLDSYCALALTAG